MSNLKDVTESIGVVSSIFRSSASWASTSRKRYMLAFLIIAVPIFAVEAGLVFLLLPQFQKDSQEHVDRVVNKSKEMDYENALDAINACISSKSLDPKSVEWYCNEATDEYARLHAPRLQERVDDVVNRRAYLAMRDDVKRYLRFSELLSVENEKPTLSQRILQVTIAKPVVTIWMMTIFFVMISFDMLVKKYRKINNSIVCDL